MMLVTRDEAEYIQDKCNEIRTATTCKKKKANRKKIYIEEWSLVFDLLEQYHKELESKKN